MRGPSPSSCNPSPTEPCPNTVFPPERLALAPRWLVRTTAVGGSLDQDSGTLLTGMRADHEGAAGRWGGVGGRGAGSRGRAKAYRCLTLLLLVLMFASCLTLFFWLEFPHAPRCIIPCSQGELDAAGDLGHAPAPALVAQGCSVQKQDVGLRRVHGRGPVQRPLRARSRSASVHSLVCFTWLHGAHGGGGRGGEGERGRTEDEICRTSQKLAIDGTGCWACERRLRLSTTTTAVATSGG